MSDEPKVRTYGQLLAEPIDELLWWLNVDLQLLAQRADELTEPQRQALLAQLLGVTYLLRSPIVGQLTLERALDGRVFLR